MLFSCKVRHLNSLPSVNGGRLDRTSSAYVTSPAAGTVMPFGTTSPDFNSLFTHTLPGFTSRFAPLSNK